MCKTNYSITDAVSGRDTFKTMVQRNKINLSVFNLGTKHSFN